MCAYLFTIDDIQEYMIENPMPIKSHLKDLFCIL